jgi:hypothetical protein
MKVYLLFNYRCGSIDKPWYNLSRIRHFMYEVIKIVLFLEPKQEHSKWI